MESGNLLTENEQRLRSMRKVNTDNKLGENIRKIVVTYPNHEPAFIAIDQSKPLKDLIQKVFESMKIKSHDIEDYSLAFDENTKIPYFYITEENKSYITNGIVCILTDSPHRTVNQIITALRSNTDASANIALLQQRSFDVTFATCFIDQSGARLVMDMITDTRCYGADLEKLLSSFQKLMEHSFVSWNIINESFITGLANSMKTCKGLDGVLQNALDIFDNIVIHSTGDNQALVKKLITAKTLTNYIETGSGDIQKAVILLINSLFVKSSPVERKDYEVTLTNNRIRIIVYRYIIKDRSDIGTELKHQLYKLQCFLFSSIECQLTQSPSSQDISKCIEELRMAAFNREIEVNHNKARRESFCNYNHRLGFQDCDYPINDISSVGHGVLALNSMIYFANHHRNAYIRLILEKPTSQADSVPLQFVRSAISLTKLLCDLLSIGTPPSDECQTYQPTFYINDNPYEELFSLSIQMMAKTWHEMKAVIADFDKMVDVVKEQLTRCLRQVPDSRENFHKLLYRFTYAQIIEMWRNDIDNREQTRIYDQPVVELRKDLEEEVTDLIRRHRLHHMTKGTLFNKYKKDGNRQKDKFLFCRLSANLKSLHFGIYAEKTRHSVDKLTNKINIKDMRYLVTGKDCLNYIGVKERSKVKPGTSLLQFAIVYEASTISSLSELDTPLKNDEAMLMFTAPSGEEYSLWTDGLHALMDEHMISDLLLVDTETLLNMEQKIQLYYTTNLVIPNLNPSLPSPPDDLSEDLLASLAT